jgi:SNF2 family DNA or RNA helicase
MPLTLHAAWLPSGEPFFDGTLFFWAESLEFQSAPRGELLPTLTANVALPGRQRLPKTPSHPGQLAINQLRTLIAEELPQLPVQSMQPANATVWLPSHEGAPLARRSVLQAADKARTEHDAVRLANWQVTGLIMGGLDALKFLTHTRRQSHPASAAEAALRLRLGNDILYWSNAAKFALEMLIGQHYVPALRRNGAAGLYAIWRPALLDDRLRRRFVALVDTMPPVCRAYDLEHIAVAPSAYELTEHFVATVVDAAIRTWSNGDKHSSDKHSSDKHSSDRHSSDRHNGGDKRSMETAALQWVGQLRTAEPYLPLPPQPAFHFMQAWQAWIDQLHVTSDANFRITFELVEPDQAAQSAGMTGALADQTEAPPAERLHWTLRFYLQARDDLRLLIPADQVWAAHSGQLRFGNRRVDRPQERLLAGLGAASRLFSPIERSLRLARPDLAILTSIEAHQFLREAAPLLESNGFGVLLPEWWSLRQRTRLGLRLRLAADEDARWLSDDEDADRDLSISRARHMPIHFSWELTLGEERVSQADFEALTAHNTPLLNLRGQWIELDPQQVRAAKRFLVERQSSGEMSLLQSIRMAQAYLNQFEDHTVKPGVTQDAEMPGLPGATSPDETLSLEAVDVDGWLRLVLDHLRTQKKVTELREPAGFVGELRPYQRRGVGWLVYLRRLGLGACLADDMGLGKTVQAIAMLLHERMVAAEPATAPQDASSAAPGYLPALLICPTSVVANWRREVERFAPGLRILVHHGSGRLDGDAFVTTVADSDVVITSYGTARRDIDLLQQCTWSDLILDEAQNIKNPAAKQSQAVRRIVAHNRVALTGTPVENHLTELWSVLEFLNPGYLGSHERFRQQFMIPIERYNDDDRARELRRLVQPFLLRRLKSDPTIISDLPEKNEMVVYCSLTQEQATLYESTVQEALAALDRADGIQRRGLVLSLLTRLKQICNHPAHYLKQEAPLRLRSGKLERLTEMLEEALSVGDHALIFTQFVEMGTLLQRHLIERLQTDVIFLHGGTSAPQRDRMVQAFQRDDGPAIFVLSLRAGGSGLNLTRANHVFHFDRWWNPAVENQATDRAFRIGQRRNVQVHKFVVAGTLEERINAILESKQSLAETIVGSGENWLTELNTDELREILTLRRETLDE